MVQVLADHGETQGRNTEASRWRAMLLVLAALLMGVCLAGCSGGSSSSTAATESASSDSASAAAQSAEKEESSSSVAKPKLVGIEAEYYGPTKPGTVIDSDSDIDVTAIYDDGSTEEVDGWKVKKAVKLKQGADAKVVVVYKKQKATIVVTGDVPSEYLSALRKAQSYSDMMHMSKAGVYDQLTSEYGEGFSAEAAEYAVGHVEADWNANALEKARSYRDMMSMSPSAIHDQLTSEYGEKFTQEEADYAIEHLDEDSAASSDDGDSEEASDDSKGGDVPTEYKTALRKAQSYVDTMHMSKAGLYDQLTSEYGEKYSAEAAQYAIDNVDADWNANALEKARSYRDMMDMSPSAIHDQLTSEYGEKFTQEEADYAIEHLDD